MQAGWTDIPSARLVAKCPLPYIFGGTRFLPCRCLSMAGFFDRAGEWRKRAAELRCNADGMITAMARKTLIDQAVALEHHATNIEQVTVKFRRIHEAAADPGLLQRYIRRYPARSRASGD